MTSLDLVFWSEMVTGREGVGCVSLCSPGWPGTYCVDQAGLKLTENCLLLLLQSWD